MKRNYSLEEFGVKKHDITLKNGLRVVFIEKPFSPIFAKMMIGAGSVYAPSGLAHFAEHVIVGASKKYPKKELLAGIVNKVGGNTNARTGFIAMSVECEIAVPEHLQYVKEHFSEVLEDVYITTELLDKEKGVITSEIKKKTSNPEYNAGVFTRGVLSKGTIWGDPVIGTVESISDINITDVIMFFEQFVTVENMILTICGGCTLSDIEKTFGDIKLLRGGRRSVLPKDPEPLDPKQRIFFQQGIDETNIGVIFQAPKADTRESYIFNFVLNHAHSGLDSKFFQKIRNEKGLAYSLFFSSMGFDWLNYSGTRLGIPPNKVDEAIDTILECYRELLLEGMTEQQIKLRIERKYFADKRIMERSIDWIGKFDQYLYEEATPIIGDYPDCFNFFETITPEEIEAVLSKYITLDNFHLVINGKEPSKKYF